MTRAQLRSLVRDYVQESSTTPLSDALINDLLRQGEEALSDLAEYSAAKFTETFVTNDIDYELSADLLSILSVAWREIDTSTDLVPIAGPTTHQRMDAEISDWRNTAAARPERWWVLGNALLVHPKPSAVYNTTTIEIYGTTIPTAMAGDGSEPSDLPTRFHRTLAKYAAWKWLAIDKENPTAQRMARFWEGEFTKDAVRLRNLIWGRADTDGEQARVQVHRDSFPSATLVDEEDQ